jgi:DNA-binding NarL/FixJ family response regulator
MSLRICCLDDRPICLHAIRRCLEETSHQCIGQSASLQALKAFLEDSECDLLIAEVMVQGIDILEEWSALQKLRPQMRLLFYSYNVNPIHVARASAIDAWDFVFKIEPTDRLLQSCNAIASGQRPEGSKLMIARRYLEQHHLASGQLNPPLTRREQDIIVHLSLGLTNREISQSLSIGLETVKEHMQKVMRKIKVSDRTAAAVWSIENGIPPLVLVPSST